MTADIVHYRNCSHSTTQIQILSLSEIVQNSETSTAEIPVKISRLLKFQLPFHFQLGNTRKVFCSSQRTCRTLSMKPSITHPACPVKNYDTFISPLISQMIFEASALNLYSKFPEVSNSRDFIGPIQLYSWACSSQGYPPRSFAYSRWQSAQLQPRRNPWHNIRPCPSGVQSMKYWALSAASNGVCRRPKRLEYSSG